jgi:hypothetical protein
LLLLLPLSLGAALRVGLAWSDQVISNDATAYLESGRSLLDGDGYARYGIAELHFPPVTPIVLAAAWDLTGDPEVAFDLVVVATGLLLVFPVAALARRLGGDLAGLGAATAVALVPGLAVIPSAAGGGSENIYVSLLMTTVWLVVAMGDVTGWRRGAMAALAGATGGLAYLTRPEGLFVVALVLAAVVLGAVRGGLSMTVTAEGGRSQGGKWGRWTWNVTAEGGRSQGGGWGRWTWRPWTALRRHGPALARVAVPFVAAFAMLAAPYVAFLHGQTGRWELTAKSRDASIEAWRAVAETDRGARDRILYKLDDDGERFERGGRSLVALAADDPAGYAGIVGVNARELADFLVVPRLAGGAVGVPRWVVIPLPLLAFALWGGWRRRHARPVPLLAAVGAVSIATALGFFVQPRYLTPALGPLCVMAGVALPLLRHSGRRVWGAVAIIGVLILVVPVVDDIPADEGIFATYEPVEHELAGEWLAAHAAPEARVMTRSMVVEFYAGRPTVAMPAASLADMLAFARHHGVEYLVLDEFLMWRFRPQFLSLFDPGPWPGLRLVHELTYEGRVTRIFALDPVPTELSINPPGLGFVGDS